MIVYVDFKNRRAISGPSHSATAKPLLNDFQPRSIDPIAHWKRMVESCEARFSDNQPEQGCVYKQPLNKPIFDTYGNGNAHNSLHQYMPTNRKYWNSPTPFQGDLPAIETYLKRNGGKVLVLGHKSDAFMWMDTRYEITKSVLEIANKHNVQLEIRTMSDLCACNDYLDLIIKGKHSVVMTMGFSEIGEADLAEKYEKSVSPGAPSLKRRQLAIDKLR